MSADEVRTAAEWRNHLREEHCRDWAFDPFGRVLTSILSDYESRESQLAAAEAVAARYRALATPEIQDFLKGVEREALHQRDRWKDGHDSSKSPEDWLWLIAYLCTKAAQAHRYFDYDKHLHHVITAGAALLNWHFNALNPPKEPSNGE